MSDPLVYTTKGLVPLSSLEIRDQVEYFDNARKVTSNYYLGGEFVRNDVHVSVLRPLTAEMQQGSL